MKTTLAILMGLASATAMAQPSDCYEPIDHGYSVHFQNGGQVARVSLTTFVNTKEVAVLFCEKTGEEAVSARCYEPDLVDAGFSLVLKKNNTATLYEVSFAGSQPVAELACH